MAEFTEVEVKLLVDGRGVQRLTALPVIGAALKRAPRRRIETAYYDTPDHVLERHGYVLRLRKDGSTRLLSVKQQPGAAVVRKEWERRIPGNEPKAADWRGTPVEPLLEDRHARASLRPLFSTVIDRAAVNTRYDGALIEVAFDRGEIRHNGHRIPVNEVELELKDGEAGAVFALARELARNAPLRLSLLSKSERGHLLNSGAWGMPSLATRPRLTETTGLRDGIQIIARTCVKDFTANEDALTPDYAEEAVHQARIALRRLRSALSLFKSVVADAELPRLKSEIGWLWDLTGQARDLDVMMSDIHQEMCKEEEKSAGIVALADLIAARRDGARRRLLAALRSDRFRLLFIDLIRWIENGKWSRAGNGELDEPIMSIVRGLLDKRLRKLKKRVRRIAKATPPERHRIRIAAKKLRLMCEFFESLVCEGRPRKRYDRIVSALNNVQKVLGRLQDDVVRRSFLAQLSREWPATSHDHLSIERAIEAITLGRSKTASLLKKARSKSADLAAAKVFL